MARALVDPALVVREMVNKFDALAVYIATNVAPVYVVEFGNEYVLLISVAPVAENVGV